MTVSVDTYKPAVARAAIAAGASIVNDVSGLRDPELAAVCAQTGVALVLMHTLAVPKQRLQDPDLYGEDVTGEVLAFLRARIELALGAGVSFEQLILDPGPDFAKTPAQTIALLANVGRLHELGRPLLLAISRKDFIGALTSRPPRERLAGTLAALADGLDGERTSSGCTMSRPPPTTWRCAQRCAGSWIPAGIWSSPRNFATSVSLAGRLSRDRPARALGFTYGCRPLTRTRPGANRPIHQTKEKHNHGSIRPLRAAGQPAGRFARDCRPARSRRISPAAQGRSDRRDPR